MTTLKSLKHKQAIAKLNNKSVIIYYSLQGKEMRFPTGVSIATEKGTIWNPIDWDSKTGKLRLAHTKMGIKEDVEKLNQRQATIDNLLKKANNFINEYFQKDILITPSELQSLMANQQEEKIQRANTGFFDYYQEFLDKKSDHFKARGNIISLKDYNSTKLLLLDFQAYQNKTLRALDVNKLWLQDFVQYMAIPHDEYHGEHKVSSKGEMKESTIKKRLDILAEFFGYLKELKVVGADEVETIKSYKKTIQKAPTHKETLDIDEIHALYKFKFTNQGDVVIRDLFVFLCLTGIRYQDLNSFDKRFIKKSQSGEGYIYKKAASKTGLDYQIPLCKIVLDILEKYEYQLPKVSDAYGNRAIKKALKTTGMFNDYTQIIDKETKEYLKRYEAITLHKGRNSFITNLVDVTPLNELMKYTGHKKLSTLQGYIDVKRPVKMEYISVFDFKTA